MANGNYVVAEFSLLLFFSLFFGKHKGREMAFWSFSATNIYLIGAAVFCPLCWCSSFLQRTNNQHKGRARWAGLLLQLFLVQRLAPTGRKEKGEKNWKRRTLDEKEVEEEEKEQQEVEEERIIPLQQGWRSG
jgi:hypothetical protein